MFPCFLQARLPHDDNDVYDRHVLPAGHPHRTRMEHVICNYCTKPKTVCMFVCVTSPSIPYVVMWWATRRTGRLMGTKWSAAAILQCRPAGTRVTGASTKISDHDDAWVLGDWSALKSFCQKLEPFLLSPREQNVPLLEKNIVPVHSGVKGAISSIVVTQCDSSHDHTDWLLETFRTRSICFFTYSLPNACWRQRNHSTQRKGFYNSYILVFFLLPKSTTLWMNLNTFITFKLQNVRMIE